jgi:hypothetical protein
MAWRQTGELKQWRSSNGLPTGRANFPPPVPGSVRFSLINPGSLQPGTYMATIAFTNTSRWCLPWPVAPGRATLPARPLDPTRGRRHDAPRAAPGAPGLVCAGGRAAWPADSPADFLRACERPCFPSASPLPPTTHAAPPLYGNTLILLGVASAATLRLGTGCPPAAASGLPGWPASLGADSRARG